MFRRQAEHFALLGAPVDGRIARGSDRFPHPWNDWYHGEAAFADLAADSPMVEVFFVGDAA